MKAINPYLNFNGTTEEAFNFYKSVFGGTFATIARMKDVPPMPEMENLSESDQEKIMHISLVLPNGTVLMASDILESMEDTFKEGSNFNLSINTENENEATTIFNGLSEGGTITMPLDKTFWGAYFGMCRDRFGIHWMVNYDYNQQ
jgi:PhnB protein